MTARGLPFMGEVQSPCCQTFSCNGAAGKLSNVVVLKSCEGISCHINNVYSCVLSHVSVCMVINHAKYRRHIQ